MDQSGYILVLDPDQQLRLLPTVVLADADHQVYATSSTRGAPDAAEEQSPVLKYRTVAPLMGHRYVS